MALGYGGGARQEEILTRFDGGQGPKEIAAALGLAESYATNVVHRLGNAGKSRKFEDMVERGSAALLRELCRHHPDVAVAARVRSPDTG